MAQTLAQKMKVWRGERTNGECAQLLGIPAVTFRKYLYGERKPNPLALAELERRMKAAEAAIDETKGKNGDIGKAAK